MKPTEVVEHLVRFAEDPEEVATMTPKQIRAELEAEGVDLNAEHARLRERLAAIEAAKAFVREVQEGGSESTLVAHLIGPYVRLCAALQALEQTPWREHSQPGRLTATGAPGPGRG